MQYCHFRQLEYCLVSHLQCQDGRLQKEETGALKTRCAHGSLSSRKSLPAPPYRHAFVAQGHFIQRTLHPRTCGESERCEMSVKNAYFICGQYNRLFVSQISMRISSHLPGFHCSCQYFSTKRVHRSAYTISQVISPVSFFTTAANAFAQNVYY
jgi:hypothetical protein